jgi:Ca2+/Na+ antiporter
MKTWKLVSGILSIVMFVFVSFQSCAAGVSNSLEANGEVSGSAGVIVAILLLAGGIVSIASRRGSKGGNIALIVLFGLGALFGFTMAGSYKDLNIWAAWCLICVILAIISLVKGKKVQ